jgi:hypothetical protein
MDTMKLQINQYNEFLEFFLTEIDFGHTYLCVHYPFKYDFIIANWRILEVGSAHYSVYLNDSSSIYRSDYGLSYNKNIRWNCKLRSKYEYGMIDPFNGYVVGTGGDPVEMDERDYFDHILPLDIRRDIEILDNINQISWIENELPFLDVDKPEEFDPPPQYNFKRLDHNYPNLNFMEFFKIWKNSSLLALASRSIWANTLSKIVDIKFCERILFNNPVPKTQ